MIQERFRQWTVLIASFIFLAFFSPQARSQQNTNLTVTIPIKKDRRYYYRAHEDGAGVACGVRLYGVWEVYKNYTNLSSYSSWRAALVGIQNPSSPTLVIDGDRKYFQVYCYFNGTDTPRNDPPCDHTIGEQHPDWEIRLTRTPPRASFTTTLFPSTPGEVKFQSTSVDPEDPEGNALRPAWEFGDGGTGNTDIQIHRYTKPGRFNAKLTVTNPDGFTSSATRNLIITAPRPIVSIQLLSKHSRNRIEPEEEFRVRVKVEASTDGVGSLTNLVFTGPPLFVPSIFTILNGPTETNIGNLQPGQKKEFDWTLRTVGVGDFSLVAASVSGRDEAGQSVFGSSATLRGEVTSLIVGVEQKPARVILGYDNNGDGDTNELDHLVEIVVAVTNVTKQPITEVKAVIVDDPIQLTSIGQDLNIWLTPVNVPPGDFGTVSPGPENAVYKTNKYEATGRTYATASTLLQGKAGDAGVQVRGEGTIKVGGEILLEARFDLEDRPYKAGQVVRVFGSLKNVSRFKSNRGEVLDEGKTIGVVVYPVTEGNGTGGYLFEKGFGGRTPDSPSTFILAPDEEQEIAAILPTAETPQETNLKLTYIVHAFIHGEDPKPRRADPTTIDVIEKDGWSASHTVPLIPVPAVKDDPYLVCPTDLSFAGFVSCRFSEGLFNFGGGMADLGLLVGSGLKEIAVASWKWHAWKNWATRQVILGLLGDKAALERMATELAIDLKALQDVGAEGLQGVTIVASSILPALERNFIHTMQTLESGDMKQIAGGLARITGENIDMPLEALVAARSARKALLVTEAAESIAKQALQESFERQAAQLGRNVEEFAARQSIQDLPTSDVLPIGMDVLKHPRIWRDAYGALQQNIDDLLQIAKDEGVLLAFRSRSPKALEAIEKGLAILKPGGVSIKTVSEIDVKYLGYPGKYEGTCVLVSPPFDWKPRGFDRDLAVEKYLDEIPELNGNGPEFADLREQVRQRLHFQLDEWPKQLKNFRKYQKQGIDVNFNAKRQNVPEEKMPDNSSFRNARLKREVIEGNPPRRVYALEMEDEYTGSGIFRPIAGDIDMLGMFMPDGSLPDLAARIRIYEKLRAVGAQHGESFTYYMQDLRDKFLRCCSPPPFGENEKMLTATPDGKLLTTLYRDELSVVEGGVNNALKVGEGEFAFLAGALTELDSVPRVGTPAVLPPELIVYEGIEIRTIGNLARITDDIDAVIDRKDGKLVRVGPDGQPEVYAPPGAPRPPTSPALPAPPAGRLRQAAQNPIEAALDAELSGLIAAGYANERPMTRAGASGGQWWPVSQADVLSAPNGSEFRVAPYTYTSLEVPAGTNAVPIFSPSQMGVTGLTQFFAVGDTLVLDPGGPTEEIVTVASVSPFAFSRPLQKAKKLGTMVLFLSGASDVTGGPSSLPAQDNLLVWLKADAGTRLSPTNVISWTDQSRNGFVFTPPSEAARPTLVANAESGLPALRFDSAQRDQLNGNLGQTLSNATIFTLMRFNPQSSTHYVYAFGTRNTSGYMMTLARRNSVDAYHYDGAAEWATPGTWGSTNLVVLSQTYGGSGQDHHRLDLSGKTVIDSRTSTGRPYSAVATNVVIGNYLSATYHFSGDLVEWIVYDRALTQAETSQVEEYLRRRAGLPPFPAKTNVTLASVGFLIGTTNRETASWTYNPTNGVFHADGGAAPSLSVLDEAFPGETVHLQVTAAETDGAIGVVFGYENRGNFHLLDWRALPRTNSVGEVGPAGLRLVQFHLPPDIQAARFNDFYASTNAARTTVLLTNQLTWIPDRIYDVFLRSSTTGLSIEIFDDTAQLISWHLPEWTGPVGWFGLYSHGAEAAEFGPVTITEAPVEEPVLISISRGAGGGQWNVQWSGGPGPFLLERTSDLASGVWLPLGNPDSSPSRTISAEGEGGFFRVRRVTSP